jgi:NTP pyrophosphatase (non-canonical NTP hydrolase)
MKISVYKKSTVRTLPDLSSLSSNLSHMVEGMSSELAELQRCLNKKITGGFDKINCGEEIADGFWYGFNWANLRGIEIPENLFDNLEKGYETTDIAINIGDLADISKRLLAYKTPFEVQEQKRKDNPKEEFKTETAMLYSYLVSLARVAVCHDISIEDIMGKNILKLYVRYPDKFSEDSALIRDLEAERAILESNIKEVE